MTNEQDFITTELTASERSLAILERLIATADPEHVGPLKLDTFKTQHQQWTRYRACLVIVRDDKPAEVEVGPT